MKRLLLVLVVALSCSSVFATESSAPSVRITSYTYVNQERKLAELCGVVDHMNRVPTFVQVTVDHNSNRPAHYNILAGPHGKFCTVVVTYFGTANVRLF